MVMVAVPNEFATGVIVKVRFAPLPPKTILARGIMEVLFVETVICNSSSSTSINEKAIGPATWSSNIVISSRSLITGASGMGDTVNVKVLVVTAVGVPLWSSTVMVISDVP
ncbi:hypothetical protein SDC9_160582 [bioreactor metagenome]|uniref:Uncharacterized protein n=1 Tax=bioreactor metagenome TaxID=1076179 RepID=A0A645FFW9_9ZZZZ